MSYSTGGPIIRKRYQNRQTGERTAEIRANLTVEGDLDVQGEITQDGQPLGGSSESVISLSPVATFTHAQIRSIPADAGGLVTLLAAPGAGKVNVFLGAYLVLNTTAGVYGFGSSASWCIAYALGGSVYVPASGYVPAVGLLDVAAESYARFVPATFASGVDEQVPPFTGLHMEIGTSAGADPLSSIENRALELVDMNAGAAYSGGHASNTLTARLLYATIDV